MNTLVIVTHHGPHLEERFGIWMLKNFGTTIFPGVDTAKMRYVDAGTVPEGAGADEREELGELWIGVGGGRFDEHPVNDANGTKKRVENECAATLIANALGLRNKPEFKQLLDAILTNDTKGGGGNTLNIAKVVNQMNQMDHDTDAIQSWAEVAFNVFYRTQLEFFATESDFRNPDITSIDTIKVPVVGSEEPKEFRLVVTTSANKKMSEFARSSFGCRASLVIQRNSENNQTYISGYTGSAISMEMLAGAIRRTELAMRGKRVTNPRDLYLDGTILEVPEWNFHKGGGWIMNGSPTAPGKTRSKIPLEKLRALAHDVIQKSFRN